MYDAALPLLKRLLKKCPSVEKVTRFGRRNLSYLVTLPSGKTVYIVLKRNMQMYRGREYSQSDALQKDVASWAVDNDALRYALGKSVDMIMIFVKDSGEVYVSPIGLWLDRSIAKDIPMRVGPDTRHLGVHHMARSKLFIPLTKRRRS